MTTHFELLLKCDISNWDFKIHNLKQVRTFCKQFLAGVIACLATGFSHADTGIRVFAAASLADAVSEASATYQQKHGIKVIHSFASSATLAKQIEAGAPANVYISASSEWMDYLQKRKLIVSSSRRDFLSNRLVLVVPKGKPIRVKFEPEFGFAAAFEGRICMANVDSVPAGRYGKQSLESLHWWQDLRSRIVETQDVRAALAFVEHGECRAGIVYESDARISRKVEIAGFFPDASHAPIVYPVALVSGSESRHKVYLEHLQSPAIQAIFLKHGFRLIR